jgi:hypothetical protein
MAKATPSACTHRGQRISRCRAAGGAVGEAVEMG